MQIVQRWIRSWVLTILCGFWLAPASAVTALTGFELQAPIVDARVSEITSRYVVVTRNVNGEGATLHVLDAFEAEQTFEVGTLSLPIPTDMSVSPDGREALFVVAPPPTGSPLAADHDVIAVDLHDPARPTLRWRERYPARSLVLAANAAHFAYSRPVAGRAMEWETVVVSSPDRHELRVIAELPSAFDTMALSVNGKFLAATSRGSLRVWALDGRHLPPAVNLSAASDRFAGSCIYAVDESGGAVVGDARTSRISTYWQLGSDADLQRHHAIPLDAMPPGCRALRPREHSSTLLIAGELGRVVNVRHSVLTNPRLMLVQWQLPPGYEALTTAGHLILAARREQGELRLFQLDHKPLPPVDWRPIEQAYQAGPADTTDLVARLETAGISSAVSAPVDHVPPWRAAVILNDYGLQLTRLQRAPARVEAALRRAIELDPLLAAAWLNLADAMRAGIGRFAGLERFWGGESSQVRFRNLDMAAHYKTYLAAGGAPTASTTSFLRGDPSDRIGIDTCTAIAAWANAGRLQELMSDVAVDMKWQDRSVDLRFTAPGSGQAPRIDVFDAYTDVEIPGEVFPEPARLARNLKQGDELGLLTLHWQYHILHYRNGTQPVATIALKGGAGCEFSRDPQRLAGEWIGWPR